MDRRLRDFALRGRILFDPEFTSELARRFPQFDHLSPDLRAAVSMAYAQVGAAGAADELWRRLKAGDDLAQQEMVRALGSFADPVQVADTFSRASRGDIPFSQIIWLIIEAVRRPQARPEVWKWFLEHRDSLIEGFAGTSTLGIVMEDLVSAVGTDDPKAVHEYFAAHPVPGAERGVQKALEYADLFARLRARRAADGAPVRVA